MNTYVHIKTFSAPPLNIEEILRYAGCKNTSPQIKSLLDECLSEVTDILSYKVCYSVVPVSITESFCDLSFLKIRSTNLVHNLEGCKKAIIFAATVGIKLDRLITKYSRISPAKAVLLQAVGTERIEALCDAFTLYIADKLNSKLTHRFSPGYGDLSLSCQKDIFSYLECAKNIGVTLNDSMLMSPTKSVTAILGLIDNKEDL